MRESYFYADFPSGYITERIVSSLSNISFQKLADLIEAGKLVFSKSENPDAVLHNLTYRNLRWQFIDDYAEACNLPLRAIIYGDMYPEKTEYSYFDDTVIPLLNMLTPEMICAATEVLHAVFYNPRFRISFEDTPSAKILAVAVTSWRLPQLVEDDELTKYQMNINDELSRLRTVRHKERFVFHLDYILDMCHYCHVSPHWAFSLKGPLICNSSEADNFFDLFCLLSKQQQIYILSMLLEMCQQDVPQDQVAAIRHAIKQKGGVVECR